MSEAFQAASQAVKSQLRSVLEGTSPVAQEHFKAGRDHTGSHPNMIADLAVFHQTYGAPILLSPSIPPKERQALRLDLVQSEAGDEFREAWNNCQSAQHHLTAALRAQEASALSTSLTEKDQLAKLVNEWTLKSDEALAELADAIADSIYVLIGTALEYGIPLAPIWNEVQRSNMAKLWTQYEILRRIYGSEFNGAFRSGDPEEQSGTLNLTDQPAGPWTYQLVQEVAATGTARHYVVKNHLGKVMKPPSWTPPALLPIIRKAKLS